MVPVPAHTRQTCCRTVAEGPGSSRSVRMASGQTDARSISLDSLCAHLHVRVQGLCGSCASSHATNLLQDCGAGPEIRKKCPHGKRKDYCKVYISGLLMCPSACACVRTLWFLCQLTRDKLAAGLWRRAPDRQEVSAWQAASPLQGVYLLTPYVPICMCVCKDSAVPVPAHTRQTCCRTVAQVKCGQLCHGNELSERL